jgi:hypothetical protein
MKAFILLLVLVISPCVFLNGQNIRWAEVINNAFTDNIFDLQVDNDHNLVICGQFNGTVDFDPGPAVNAHTSAGGADIFLAKYDSLGNYLWAHHFGTGFLTDEGDRLAIDSSGNIFLTGMFGSTVDFDPSPGNSATISSSGSNRSRFLAKYDVSGNFIAVKHVGGAVGSLPSSQDGQAGLGCDAAGNVYMCGFYGTSLTLGPGVTLPVAGLSDNYFAKYDPQLNLLWGHRLGSSGSEYSQGMYVHPSGKIIVLGSFSNMIDFDPDTSVYTLTQVSSTADGYFAQYDSSGKFVRVAHLEPGNSATPIVAFIDKNDNVIISGSCTATMDADPGPGTAIIGAGFNDQAFVARYDSSFNYNWAFAFGDINTFNAIRYMSLDTSGNIYVAGPYNPWVDIDPGADTAVFGNKYGEFVASFDTAGGFRTGFYMQDAKMRVKENDIYLAGNFYGLTDVDPGPQVYNLQSDTLNTSWYLLRMNLCENYAISPGTIQLPPFCAGDTTIVSVNTVGPAYEWTFTQGLTPIGPATGNSVTIAVSTSAMQETITVQNIYGCINSPLVYTNLNINQHIIPVISQSNDTLFSNISALSYQWLNNGIMIPGASDSIFVPDSSGVYSVLITDLNGCVSVSDPVNVVITAMHEIPGRQFYVYPNPSSGTIHFSSPLHSLQLRNVFGQIVKSENTSTGVLYIGDLSDGVYYLHSHDLSLKIILNKNSR